MFFLLLFCSLKRSAIYLFYRLSINIYLFSRRNIRYAFYYVIKFSHLAITWKHYFHICSVIFNCFPDFKNCSVLLLKKCTHLTFDVVAFGTVGSKYEVYVQSPAASHMQDWVTLFKPYNKVREVNIFLKKSPCRFFLRRLF